MKRQTVRREGEWSAVGHLGVGGRRGREWLVNEAITSGLNPFTTDLIFYPVGANLARYNLSPGFFPITFLVEILKHCQELYPQPTYSWIHPEQ